MLRKGNMAVIAVKNPKYKTNEYMIGEVHAVNAQPDCVNGARKVFYDIFVAEENHLYMHIPHHQANSN